jgi:hypothetical protein
LYGAARKSNAPPILGVGLLVVPITGFLDSLTDPAELTNPKASAAPRLARPLIYQVPLWQPPPSVPEPAVQVRVVVPFVPFEIVKVLLTPPVRVFETAVIE